MTNLPHIRKTAEAEGDEQTLALVDEIERMRSFTAFKISEAAQVKAELIADPLASDYRQGWQSGFMAALEEISSQFALKETPNAT